MSHETTYNCIYPQPLRNTLTYDQGKEMALHKQLTINTGMAVYFCDPHSHGNVAAMRAPTDLPKGTDLSGYSQEQLDAIADESTTDRAKDCQYDLPWRFTGSCS